MLTYRIILNGDIAALTASQGEVLRILQYPKYREAAVTAIDEASVDMFYGIPDTVAEYTADEFIAAHEEKVYREPIKQTQANFFPMLGTMFSE